MCHQNVHHMQVGSLKARIGYEWTCLSSFIVVVKSMVLLVKQIVNCKIALSIYVLSLIRFYYYINIDLSIDHCFKPFTL